MTERIKPLGKLTNMKTSLAIVALAFGTAALGPGAAAQPAAVQMQPTYADLADLADGTPLVLRAEIRKQIALKPERAPDVPPGMVRLYIEARTIALLSGNTPVGESLKYLVDVPLTDKGKVPKLKKQEFILFARPVAGRPGEIQLIAPSSQLAWSPETEQRLRGVLTELLAADAPPAISGIRDALSIAGNLAGESETQIFVSTKADGPVSLTVIRRPGQSPMWGVSWSEIVDQAARPPQPGTLAWYRLACFLPDALPRSAILSQDRVSLQRAAEDYGYIRSQLGPCPRNRS